MPPALGTTLAISRRCAAFILNEAVVSPELQAAANSGRAQHQGNVHGHDEHRYRASGIGRWHGPIAGAQASAALALAGAGAMSVTLSQAEISSHPNPLDTAAQSYQGGAVAPLDFTAEVERPKAAHGTCPTTT